jgi:hypothetical protein
LNIDRSQPQERMRIAVSARTRNNQARAQGMRSSTHLGACSPKITFRQKNTSRSNRGQTSSFGHSDLGWTHHEWVAFVRRDVFDPWKHQLNIFSSDTNFCTKPN